LQKEAIMTRMNLELPEAVADELNKRAAEAGTIPAVVAVALLTTAVTTTTDPLADSFARGIAEYEAGQGGTVYRNADDFVAGLDKASAE
jgi:hypothetical protein